MVGNGVTDDVFDGNALIPFAHGMGLISDDLYRVGGFNKQMKFDIFIFLLNQPAIYSMLTLTSVHIFLVSEYSLIIMVNAPGSNI